MELAKLAGALLLVAILLYRKVNMGIAMMIGAIFLGLIYPISIQQWIEVPASTFFGVGNLKLLLALYLIMMLENILRTKGVLDRMMRACQALIPDGRVIMASLPAFIGFLPSLGGALFSAPLVDQAAQGYQLSAERKFMINFWFRHIWEYFLPIYPSILLASAILNVPQYVFVTNLYMFSLLAVFVGAIVCFYDVKSAPVQDLSTLAHSQTESSAVDHFKNLLFALSPVVAMLIMVIAGKVDVAIATVIVLAILILYYHYSLPGIWQVVREAFSAKIMIQVVGVLFFKEMLLHAGIVKEVVKTLNSMGVSAILLVMSMSFIIACLTGISQAVVAVVFPLISGYPAEMQIPLAMISIATCAAAQMITPMHLCMVVTAEYYKAKIMQVIPKLAVMEGIILFVAYKHFF